MDGQVGRREFLRLSTVAAAGAVLAACAPDSSRPSPQLGIDLTSNKSVEAETLDPNHDMIDFMGASLKNGVNFYKMEKDQELLLGAKQLFDAIATEQEKNSLLGNPMDWLLANFVPNFENQGIISEPQDYTQAPPTVYQLKSGKALCEHTAKGLDKDEKLGRTPDHNTLSWVILAGTLAASGIGAKLVQVGLEQGSFDSHALVYTAEATLVNVESYLTQKGLSLQEFAWLKEIARQNETGELVVNVRAAIPDVRTGYPPSIYFLGKAAESVLKNGLKEVFQPGDRELIKTAKRILQKLLSDALKNPKLNQVCDEHKLLDGIKLNKSIPLIEIPDDNPFKITTCETFGLANMATICLFDPTSRTDVYIMEK